MFLVKLYISLGEKCYTNRDLWCIRNYDEKNNNHAHGGCNMYFLNLLCLL